MDKQWLSLYTTVLEHVGSENDGLSVNRAPAIWKAFSQRLKGNFEFLGTTLFSLYGQNPAFSYVIEELVRLMYRYWRERPLALKERDDRYSPESLWYASEKQVGAVAYVDRFSGTFAGLANKITYLQELGVTYLHLMPFYRGPSPDNDGGYAVSSYRESDPRLGSMKELEELAAKLWQADIVLVADFIFNHTSDDHEWALRAKAGENAYLDYYFTFKDKNTVEEYQKSLRDIFPEVRSGSFTWNKELSRWVWTTFHSYQWDLNYTNPQVFLAMAAEMLSLANRGITVLRLDAVAFIWKKKGTSCENLDEAHALIKAFNAVARVVCPSLLFKSEAIVHPDDIKKYISHDECRLSYNPLLMAELWEAAATKETRLLRRSLEKRHSIRSGCAWVNYVRCHDDIGWTFADEDAAELGIKGGDHRNFLNDFYLGCFPGSFSKGLSFQHNIETGDRRICGTAASLAGIESALMRGDAAALAVAVRRLLLLYGIVFSIGGIPLLYLGDEIAVLNDYDYKKDAASAHDTRWVHRPPWPGLRKPSSQKEASTNELVHPASIVLETIKLYSRIRKAHPVFGVMDIEMLNGAGPSILAFRKHGVSDSLLVLANFADYTVNVDAATIWRFFEGREALSLLEMNKPITVDSMTLDACDLKWIIYR